MSDFGRNAIKSPFTVLTVTGFLIGLTLMMSAFLVIDQLRSAFRCEIQLKNETNDARNRLYAISAPITKLIQERDVHDASAYDELLPLLNHLQLESIESTQQFRVPFNAAHADHIQELSQSRRNLKNRFGRMQHWGEQLQQFEQQVQDHRKQFEADCHSLVCAIDAHAAVLSELQSNGQSASNKLPMVKQHSQAVEELIQEVNRLRDYANVMQTLRTKSNLLQHRENHLRPCHDRIRYLLAKLESWDEFSFDQLTASFAPITTIAFASANQASMNLKLNNDRQENGDVFLTLYRLIHARQQCELARDHLNSEVQSFYTDVSIHLECLGDVHEHVTAGYHQRIRWSMNAAIVLAFFLVAIFLWSVRRVYRLVIQHLRHLQQATQAMEKFRRAVESAPVSVVITDARGNIEYVNPFFTTVTGYQSEQVIGKNPKILKSGVTPESVFTEMWQTIIDGKVWRGELCNRKKSGELFWEAMAISAMKDSEGTITHYVAVKDDISQRVVQQTELKEKSQLLRDASWKAGMAEVASGILHNVGNVLNSVNVSLNWMNEQLVSSSVPKLRKASEILSQHQDNLPSFLTEDPRGKHFPRFFAEFTADLTRREQAQHEELRSLTRNVDHIKEIIRRQQRHATVATVIEEVDVCELMEDALQINQQEIQRNRIDVIRDYKKPIYVIIDRHRVLQILVNLISNARKALAQSELATRTLSVSIVRTADTIEMSVVDNGVGIPAENLEKVFRHGFTTGGDGNGIGLHCSALSAQELGGSLAVQSEGSNRGARFTLRLPVKESQLCLN